MKIIICLAAVAALAGCATGPSSPEIRGNVTPKPNNEYTVESRGDTTQKSTARALESATAICKERGLRHVVTSQKAEYKGAYGNEAARDVIDAQSKTIAAMQRKTWFYPSWERRNDYQTTMDFKCEP